MWDGTTLYSGKRGTSQRCVMVLVAQSGQAPGWGLLSVKKGQEGIERGVIVTLGAGKGSLQAHCSA